MIIRWEEGFEIHASAGQGAAVITANRAGLRSLAMQLRDLADAAPGSHIHYDEYNSLEEGSCELIFVKARDAEPAEA
ncbi:MAG: hypothetical protein J6U26_02425 [Lachnospiraceae bacterium]|nr:hypothetical protein [Lachnospiraceae bacterium]